MKIQMTFTHFPGYEPFAQERGWRHLPTPWRSANPDDNEALGDAAMELVDWAIERKPEAFGVDWKLAAAGYEEYNDLSVELAERVLCATEGNRRTLGGGGVWSDWYEDAQLADGIVIRVACFA